jgi:hypothetical protein
VLLAYSPAPPPGSRVEKGWAATALGPKSCIIFVEAMEFALCTICRRMRLGGLWVKQTCQHSWVTLNELSVLCEVYPWFHTLRLPEALHVLNLYVDVGHRSAHGIWHWRIQL